MFIRPQLVFVQGLGHQIFKAQPLITHHQTGVVKVDLGRLQHGAGVVGWRLSVFLPTWRGSVRTIIL